LAKENMVLILEINI